MKLTVLMSVYNEEHIIQRSIQSILDQSFSDFEFLIIDDGSTDATCTILEGYNDARMRILRHTENKGLSYSLREGVEHARGEYIARIDADDVALPERFSCQIDEMDKNLRLGLLGTQYEAWDHRNDKTVVSQRDRDPIMLAWQLMFGNIFCHSTIMMRRDAVIAVGNYSSQFLTTQDYDLWVRIAREWEIGMLPYVLCRRYVSKDSITMNSMDMQDENARRISMSQIKYIVDSACSDESIASVYDLLKRSRCFAVENKTVISETLDTIVRLFCSAYDRKACKNRIRNELSTMILDGIDPRCEASQVKAIYGIAFRLTALGTLSALTRKCARKVMKNENPAFVLSES